MCFDPRTKVCCRAIGVEDGAMEHDLHLLLVLHVSHDVDRALHHRLMLPQLVLLIARGDDLLLHRGTGRQ